jgi:hypothetical protein
MKNKLFTLAAALTLAAVLGTIYGTPALAAVIKAVLVKNVDEPGRIPFTTSPRLTCSTPSGSTVACTAAGTQVPAGRRLVVQSISARIVIPTGKKIDFATVQIQGGSFKFFGLPELAVTGAAETVYVMNHLTQIYFEETQIPEVFFQISGPASSLPATIDAVFTGYLVDTTI